VQAPIEDPCRCAPTGKGRDGARAIDLLMRCNVCGAIITPDTLPADTYRSCIAQRLARVLISKQNSRIRDTTAGRTDRNHRRTVNRQGHDRGDRNPMSNELQHRLASAQQVARDAGALALSYQARLRAHDLAIQQKGTQDFVSEADRETERLIRDRLTGLYPDDGFLGEETGHQAGGEGTWIVDPIDGTTNYLHQHRHWCVSIAYVVNDEPVLGVIYDPSNDELFAALAGHGAFLNDNRLRVNQGELSLAGLVILGYSNKTPIKDYLQTIERLHARDIEHRRYGSAAISLAHVAAGRFDGYKEDFINAWDIMAGVIILREAGAWVNLRTRPNGDGYAITAGIPALAPILA
jgi:myo-inositol-1(or 4)-monophosphatase